MLQILKKIFGKEINLKIEEEKGSLKSVLINGIQQQKEKLSSVSEINQKANSLNQYKG